MGLSEKLENLAKAGTSGSDIKSMNIPEDWRPRMDVDDSKGGFVISKPRPSSEIPDAAGVLQEFGLDPREWTVSSMRRGKWQRYDGEFLESVRVNLVPAGNTYGQQLDAEQLIDEIKKWRPERGIKQRTGNGSFLVAPSDQQIGKKAQGKGTQQTADRLLSLTEKAVQRYDALTKTGLNLGTITLALPGDHVEGNVSQNGRLQGQAASDLGLTEQVRVARRLLMAQIKAFAPLAENMIVAVVNGNHDEVTRQVAADPADGWNVEIAAAVQDACVENPALEHIQFRFPDSGHQTLVVNVCGTYLGLFHGHQGAKDPMKYLSGQAAGQTPIGMADVWISGHFHNYRTMDIGSRFWAQCPTIDPGSEWYRDFSGMESNPGLLNMVIGSDYDPREFISVLPVNK